MPAIYFSDFFGVEPPTLEEYGAFNISLINDLPLFVDPFLLFDSVDEEYVKLHAEIIKYVKFLRDICNETDGNDANFREWFYFPEIKQNWMGFSETGNAGTGLGPKFGRSMHYNLRKNFADFGEESITRGSHIEKLGNYPLDVRSIFIICFTNTFKLVSVVR